MRPATLRHVQATLRGGRPKIRMPLRQCARQAITAKAIAAWAAGNRAEMILLAGEVLALQDQAALMSQIIGGRR
jgi:hypothetical protein